MSALALILFPMGAQAAHFIHPTHDYALDYPDSWHIDQALVDSGGALLVTSFPAGGYRLSGVLPRRGIEINVRHLPDSTDEETALIPNPGQTTNVRLSECPFVADCHRADYDFTLGGDDVYRTSVITFRRGGKFFVVRLSYAEKVPTKKNASIGEAALLRIVASISEPGTQAINAQP